MTLTLNKKSTRSAAIALLTLALLPGSVSAQSATTSEPESATVQQGDLLLTLSAIGRLETQQEVELSFGGSSPVVELLIEAGQRVQVGDVLARLDTTDAEAGLRSAEIALMQAQYAYDDLVAAPRDVDIAVAEASLNVAYASLNAAGDSGTDAYDVEIARLQAEQARNQLWQTQMNRDANLEVAPQFRNNNGGAQAGEIRLDSDVSSAEMQVQIADTQYNNTANDGPNIGSVSSAHAQVVQAQAELDNLVNGPSSAERRAAEIDLRNAELDVARAREQLRDLTLTAPFSGIVAAEFLTVGEMPPAGPALTLIDEGQYIINVSIDETDIVNVQPGQRAELVVDALPDERLQGTVTKLENAPVIDGQLVTYEATITLEATDAPVRPGMSATARLVLTEVQDTLLVPNRFIQTNADQQTVVTVRDANGQYVQAPVQIGARNETYSQVLSGLQEGQDIYLLAVLESAPSSFFPAPPGGGGFRQSMGG